MTAKFVNLLGSEEKITRSTFDDFKTVYSEGVEDGGDFSIILGRNEDTGEGVINLFNAEQKDQELDGSGLFTDNELNGKNGVKGFIGSQLDFNTVNGLFSQGIVNEEGEVSEEPLIWVACEYFALANGIKNKLMILPLDKGFLVALIEGVIRFPVEDGDDDLTLAREIGNLDTSNLTFMTSSRGNIQGLPENELYEQSFLTVTIKRKISNIISQRSKRNGNDDKGLSTSVLVSKHGTVLLDGGKRLNKQKRAEEEELKRMEEQEALKQAQAIKKQEEAEVLLSELASKAPQVKVRQAASSALGKKGMRNPMAEAFLNSQIGA